MMLSAVLGSIKMIIFIHQHSAGNKSFHQVFHQGCLQKISTNWQITPDLSTFTEENSIKNFKIFKGFLREMCFLSGAACYHCFFVASHNFICTSCFLATQGYSTSNESKLIFNQFKKDF